MLIYISALIFTTYVLYITIKYGVLSSISDSVYRTDKEWLFLLFTFGVGLPIAFATDHLMLQISGVLLTYVGLSPDFKKKEGIENEAHSTSAFGAAILGLLSLVIDYDSWLIVVIGLSTSIPFLFFKNRIFWVEIIAFLTVLIGLILNGV